MPIKVGEIDGATLLAILLGLTGIGAICSWLQSFEATSEYARLAGGILLFVLAALVILRRKR